MALTVSRVFYRLDAEAFRLFDNTANTRMQAFNAEIGQTVASLAGEAGGLAATLEGIATGARLAPQALHTGDDAYEAAAFAGSDTLITLLQENSVTGAFVMLAGSNANPANAAAHSAVYIRNSAPNQPTVGTHNYLLEVGPISVSQQYQIATAMGWDLDLVLDPAAPETHLYYEQPIAAAAQHPGAEMERYGYWTPPLDVLGDNKQVVCYTMPLLDSSGAAFGVLGIEISLAHFAQHYLPGTDLPYQNSFYAIAPVANGALTMDWFIPSGPLAQSYLHGGDALALQKVPGEPLYETRLDELGKMYCAVHPLTVYSANSPFADENWSLISFVPQSVLHESSQAVRTILLGSILITTLIAVGAIFLLVYLSTRKITGLSSYVNSLDPYQDIRFEPTGMREIDELTSAVSTLNHRVVTSAQATSRILELTRLPVGGFEASADTGQVIFTEYIQALLHLQGQSMPQAEWADTYKCLTAHPAEGHEGIFRYEDGPGAETRWLRIMETQTTTGSVGVVLDVTKDIEENRRLAQELDYDALTHLYNRTAFKREVHNLIQNAPEKVGAMIFSDLDNLKYINDTYGHDMGDRLIIQAGEQFHKFSGHGGIVARISGDEFAIYLHGFADKDAARELIRKQYRKFATATITAPDGESMRIRFSSGIAWFPQDSDNVTDLLKLADFAMYEAKHSEKGSIHEFDRKSYQASSYLLENREAINRLLDEKLIRFAFQPIVSLKTGEIYAYEALMRPLLDNFKSPAEILAVASAQSKLGHLERMVITLAFKTVSENLGVLGKTKIFVNSIPSQNLTVEDQLHLYKNYGHAYKNIVVEITEAENNQPQTLTDKINYLRSSGLQLAIDDYGSGYSNDIRILSIKPDVIKIDMEMVQGIHADLDKQALVTNMVNFCHPKGILIIAEGVEDKDDLATLIRLDVDFVQGYYTGRPAFGFEPVREEAMQEILRLQGSPEIY